MSDSTFLTRVELLNYKSITHCDVELRPLVFLVGPNGAGKSNFLDALRFVADALSTSLDHAIRERGGIMQVCRRPNSLSGHFAMRFDFKMLNGVTGHYSFDIELRSRRLYEVRTEECRYRPFEPEARETHFRVDRGTVTTSEGASFSIPEDRFYLVNASNLLGYRPIYDAFSRMAFYNLNAESIRSPQPSDANEILSRNGSNIASILAGIHENSPDIKRRIEEYLTAVVPSIIGVRTKETDIYEMLEFLQDNPHGSFSQVFPASSMSDGTLRALGILTALFQTGRNENHPLSLVGIEEPETALHPAASGALLDAMSEASESKQVLVTTHSAEILDNKDITADMLLAVVAEDGVTKIGPIDQASRSVMRDHLFTAGELLRINQLAPERNESANEEEDEKQIREANAA